MLYEEEEAFSTKEIFSEYRGLLFGKPKLLEYRRVFDLLNELENLGILASVKNSEGRYGYHKLYRLMIPHHDVGCMVSKNWDAHQMEIVAKKKNWELQEEELSRWRYEQSKKQNR